MNLLIPICVLAINGSPQQASRAPSWEGEWKCDMSWPSKGRFADGSLTYAVDIKKDGSNYSVSIIVEGSLIWTKIEARGFPKGNALIVEFSSYPIDNVSKIGDFKKGDILFEMHEQKRKTITMWRSMKPDQPELKGWLSPGEHFVRQK